MPKGKAARPVRNASVWSASEHRSTVQIRHLSDEAVEFLSRGRAPMTVKICTSGFGRGGNCGGANK
jgi:hypothetical protein